MRRKQWLSVLIRVFALLIVLCVVVFLVRAVVNSDMPLWLKIMILR